jgi:hypothetical protein
LFLGEKEKLKKKKSKKSKKSKKKSKKTKKSERLLLVKEEKPIDDDVAAEESSGKTLMELLELEMRARAIKALLKKEEEGIEDDEWSDHVVVVPLATLPVENDAIQRPMKAATESGVAHKYHRPNSPTTIHSTLIQRTESTSDESNRRGRRPSSDAVRHRHYRHHHHHHRQERSRSPIVARREVDLSVVKTEPPSSSINLNKSSTPPRSPLLIEATDDTTTIQVGRINSESEESKRIDDEDKSGDRGTTQVVVEEEEEEEVEYEEEGIQEVDIELGSGSSDDDAHSSCR